MELGDPWYPGRRSGRWCSKMSSMHQLCKDCVKVHRRRSHHLPACRRLYQRANTGIIVRFVDLAQRDSWLSGTKHLKNYLRDKVSISPDPPPAIQPLKDQPKEVRTKLPTDIKLKSKLKFLPHWTFVELRIDGQTPKRPSVSLNVVTTKMFDIEPLHTWR